MTPAQLYKQFMYGVSLHELTIVEALERGMSVHCQYVENQIRNYLAARDKRRAKRVKK